MGYHSQIILAGRKINDGMGKYVAENTVKLMIQGDKQIKGATVAILGLTFKENCPDVRNTKVIDIIKELKEYGIKVVVNDPQVDKDEVFNEHGIEIVDIDKINDVDAVIIAVPHEEYKEVSLDMISELYNDKYACLNNVDTQLEEDLTRKKVLIDVKGIFDREEAKKENYLYWRL